MKYILIMLAYYCCIEILTHNTSKVYKSHHNSTNLHWKSYKNFSEVNKFIKSLEENRDWFSVKTTGKSFKRVETPVVQIRKAGKDKPNVWIEAGIHGREWISIAVATYIINEIIEDKQGDRFKENLNFHILSIANPDGYIYTWSNSTDIKTRLWRKNRNGTWVDGDSIFKKNQSVANCVGVDLNRNFDFHWNETGKGKFCSQTWPGEHPFSEVEARNIRDYVLKLKPTPILALSLHSAVEAILFPYSFNASYYPDNMDELKKLADESADALFNTHGKRFRVKEVGDAFPASGTSYDWYAGVLKSRFTYTIELRKGTPNDRRWILPREEIKPSGEEVWEALRVMFKKMMKLQSS